MRRAAYDRRAAATHLRFCGVISEELDLDDFACTAAGSSTGDGSAASCADSSSRQLHRFEHGCRCGGAYAIDEGTSLMPTS